MGPSPILIPTCCPLFTLLIPPGAINVSQIQECVFLLKKEIIQFKESILRESSTILQIREELQQLQKQTQTKMGQLEKNMDMP
ncbi:Angiomotin-like protein 2 [Clarias magur]|uniref:Angiomotin-like protein 2 n=1 Tax=Clarias magur TaxID=1594786 RepID=A0A8J4WZA4_CLAMG|nr:Angiomotin-like protein 2 [Clarias magur]